MTVIGSSGLPLICETEGCGALATTVWSSAAGKQTRACDRHNPMYNTAMPLPLNFTSHTLCHACGQPVRIGGTP